MLNNKFLKKIINKKDIDIKIYIIDDEEYYLNLVKVNLNKYGFKDIRIFESAKDCLLEIENEKPDCVIVDYILNDDINGHDFLKGMVKNYPDIFVLLLSGQEDINIATEIIKDGAYEYVVKNKMTFFNLNGSLNKIKEIKSTKTKTKNKTLFYISLIIITWVLGVGFIFSIL